MQNKKSLLYIIFAFGAGLLLMYLFNNYKIEKKNTSENTEVSYQKSDNQNQNHSYSYENSSKKNKDNFEEKKSDFSNENNASSNNIDELTNEKTVINYVKSNQRLPDYYLTKGQARKQGWVPSQGNLCDVLPGRAIGGDHFSNRDSQAAAGGAPGCRAAGTGLAASGEMALGVDFEHAGRTLGHGGFVGAVQGDGLSCARG